MTDATASASADALRDRKVALKLLLPELAAVIGAALFCWFPAPLDAQNEERFTLAAGPVVAVDDSPPSVGAHLRGAVWGWPGPRPVNLQLDAYLTWLAPGTTETVPLMDGSLELRQRETQLGIGASGVFTAWQANRVAPYVLIGAVVRWSDAGTRFGTRTPAGDLVDTVTVDFTETQGDILLGAGVAIRNGTRRLLLEARLYGGTAIVLPVTIGLTF